MLSKVGCFGSRLLSRIDLKMVLNRKAIFKMCIFSAQNNVNQIHHDGSKAYFKTRFENFQKGFCSEANETTTITGLINGHCEFEKTQEENGRTSDASCEKNVDESSDKYQENETFDYTDSINDNFSSEKSCEDIENDNESLDISQYAKTTAALIDARYEFEKTQDENDRISDASSEDNLGESSNKSEENEIFDNTESNNNDFSTKRSHEELEKDKQLLKVPQSVQNESISKFELPSGWENQYATRKRAEFLGEIYIIKNHQDELQYEDILEEFLKTSALGFDTEGVRERTSSDVRVIIRVVQLATPEKAFLWHFQDNETKMPKYLEKLLTGDVHKVGHGIYNDATNISKHFNVVPKNLIDTYFLASELNIFPKSLQGLCAIYCGLYLPKNQDCDWKSENLGDKEVKYAATDAWVSLLVYQEMERYVKELGKDNKLIQKNEIKAKGKRDSIENGKKRSHSTKIPRSFLLRYHSLE